jgi:hypothetical protein
MQLLSNSSCVSANDISLELSTGNAIEHLCKRSSCWLQCAFNASGDKKKYFSSYVKIITNKRKGETFIFGAAHYNTNKHTRQRNKKGHPIVCLKLVPNQQKAGWETSAGIPSQKKL